MTELQRIREDLNKVSARLIREENHQAGRRNLPCTCACHKFRELESDKVHRLQQNLAEIKRKIGAIDCTQIEKINRLCILMHKRNKWADKVTAAIQTLKA